MSHNLDFCQSKCHKNSPKLEVAAFIPLKLDWERAVLDWHRENYDKLLNKEKFTLVLDGALKKCYADCSAIQSSRACGSYQWNPENTGFLQFLGKTKH
jgi:hypothetical protein